MRTSPPPSRPMGRGVGRSASGGCRTGCPSSSRRGRPGTPGSDRTGSSQASATRTPGRSPGDPAATPGAERLDDRRALVAEHDRALPLPLAVADVEIRVADAGRRHPDADLARPGRIELEGLDPDRHARAIEDGGPDRRRGGRIGVRGHAAGSHAAGPRADAAAQGLRMAAAPVRRGSHTATLGSGPIDASTGRFGRQATLVRSESAPRGRAAVTVGREGATATA